MKQLLVDVAAFHRQCGQPIADSPQTLPQTERINLRRDLHTEEYEELDDALEDLAHGGDRESLVCEDLPHRRNRRGCAGCGGAFAEEDLTESRRGNVERRRFDR